MLKTPFEKKESSRLSSLMHGSLLALAVVFACAGQAQAQSATSCYRSRDLTPYGSWKMAPSGTAFKNGDVVGRVSAYAQFFMPVSHGETAIVMEVGGTVANPYHAVPLAGMPGLGLVVRWGGYGASANVTDLGSIAQGTAISGKSYFQVMKARTRMNYSLTQVYDFELVIIDETLYKGGTLASAGKGQVSTFTSNQRGTGSPQVCVDGWLYPMAALTGSVQVPELPKPALPSCNFSPSALHQSVTLNSVDPGQVASQGSARTAGMAGQSTFKIVGTSCTQGTVVQVYFTDMRSSSTLSNYLLSSNSGVGVRMYYDADTTPILFGPSPSGSWVPGYQPVTVGPIPNSGIGVELPFTAQYVRRPNAGLNDVVPGPVQADAVFTVVYP